MSFSVERVRHELKFRIAEVVSNQLLTPRMARITLRHHTFAEFPSVGYDDHVKLFFPAPGVEIVMPLRGTNGLIWPEGKELPEGRDYTPRSFDRTKQEVVIDFVLHGDGPASTWAASARPGDTLGVGGPRGSFVVKGDLDFYLLAGDDTALPAIGRRIEELPSGAKVIALVEIASPAERQTFVHDVALDLHWVERSAGANLVDAVKAATIPAGDGYFFIAGELSASAAIREYLVTDRGVDSGRVKAAGYWRQGDPGHDDGHAH